MHRFALPLVTILCGAIAGATAAPAPAPAKLPPAVKALEKQGVKIVTPFKAGGLQGYAGMLGQEPVAAFVTPDGKHVIMGTMLDATGSDVTTPQLDRLVKKPVTDAVWDALGRSEWIADGSSTAPRVVYAFTDPNCAFCNKFWNESQPWVAAGKVQIRHVIVAVLSPSSERKAAALLSAKDRVAALADHENRIAEGGITPMDNIPTDILVQIARNNQLMRKLGLMGTPSIMYKDDEGNIRNAQGAPNAELLRVIMGPQ